MPKTIHFWRGRLPHWEVEDRRYFVTIHLAGEIPREASDRIHAMASSVSSRDPEAGLRIQRLIFREMERWLDGAAKLRYLADPRIAAMVREAIAFRVKARIWEVFEYVLMPNHVHLFLKIAEGSLKTSIVNFKRWTAGRAAEILGIQGDCFWQREWFDHWSRSDEEDDKITRYIRENPVNAGLVRRHVDWPYGSWHQ